jgi:hypothetical protein
MDGGRRSKVADPLYHATAEGWARDAARNGRIADLLAAAAVHHVTA